MSTTTAPAPPELNTLSIEIDGEIGTLTLDRPDSLNAMSPEMIGELACSPRAGSPTRRRCGRWS